MCSLQSRASALSDLVIVTCSPLFQAGNGREFWIKVEGGVPDAPEMAFSK